jgi:hypothetical protein
MCGVGDVQGICVRIPVVCPAVVQQVCGCDKKTYGNDCERRRAKVAKDSDGPSRSGGIPIDTIVDDYRICRSPRGIVPADVELEGAALLALSR